MTASVNNIGAMLSSMTDESFTLSAGGGNATHQNATSNTTANNNNHTPRASKNATKILAMRMLQGYTPTPHKCLECNMPLLQSSDSGIVQCVVCLERQVILSTPNGSSSTSSSSSVVDDDNTCSEEEEEEAKVEHRRQLVAEVDGILVATKSQRKTRMKGSKTDIVTITDDGDIELRRLLTMESIESYSDILVVGTDSGSGSGGGENSVVSSNNLCESDRTTDGGDEGELILPAFNSINYPHLAQEMNERSALLAAKSQSAVGKKKKNIKNKNVRLLEAIDELSAASSAKKQLRGAATTTKQKMVPTMIGEEQSSVGGSDKENSSHSPPKASPYPHKVVDDSDNTSMMSVSQHNASIINDIDSTLISYQKGKAFATQIIQDTNGILDDLVSTEGGGCGYGGDGTMSVSPSLMSDGYGKKMKKSSRGKVVDFDQQVKSVISSGASVVAPTMPTTPNKRPPKKRLTINNISSEAHHGDRKKCYMPSWDNSKKNSAEKDGGCDDMPRGAHDVSSLTLQSHQANNSPTVGEKDDFFSELRRKALLTKASATQDKLDAELGGSTIKQAEQGDVKEGTMMHIETGMNDDVSALESLPPFSPTNKTDGNVPPKKPLTGAFEVEEGEVIPNSLAKSTALVGSDTIDEIQKHWRAAKVLQLKKQQLQDEMSPAAANIQRKTTEATSTRLSAQPVVPDDEKVELALQSIRKEKEKVVLPFDEPMKLQNVASSPRMGMSPRNHVSASSATGRLNKTGIELVTVEECSSDEEVSSAAREKGQQRPGVPSQTDSIASLSSSVKLQTKRLAQLEADALRKHQEAELAATTARTALEQMMQARNARKEKESKMKEEKEKSDNNYTDLSMCSTLSSLDKKVGKDTEKPPVKHNGETNYQGIASVSNAVGSKKNKAEEESSPDSISSHDSSDVTNNDSTIDTNTTSSTYLNRHRRALEERRRGRSRSLGRSYYPTTPKTQNTLRVSRPPPLRVDDSSESSTSTSTNSTFDSMSDTKPRRPFGADRRRRTLSAPRGGRNTNLGGRSRVTPNLMLPSLNSPDPSTPSTPRRSGRTPPESAHHQHQSQSTSPHHRNVASNQHSMGGEAYERNESMYSANNMHMPSPYHQQPMTAHNHYAPGGQSGRMSPYSPSMATRMAKMFLDSTDTSRRYPPVTNRNVNVGLPPHHIYGQSKTPKSLKEQSFGFNSYAQQQRSVGGGNHYSIPSRNFDSLSLAQHHSSRMMGYNNIKDSSSYHPTMNSTQHKVRFTNNHLAYPQRHQFLSSVLPTNYESRNDYPTR